MTHRGLRIQRVALTLMLLFLTPAALAQSDAETPLRILVTFSDAAVGKLTNTPVPGRSYRYRLRYPVSATVKRDTAAIADEYDMHAVDDWPIKSLQVYCVVYEPQSAESLPQLLQQLGEDPRVESAQEMQHFESMTTATEPYNDAYAQFQHGLESMSIAAAHKIANGKGVTIAVIDSGVDLQHEDFLGSDIRSRDFVPADRGSASEAHGTAVTSLIIASPNNGRGIVGVAPGAELLAIRACWGSSTSEIARCDSFTLAKALDYLVSSPPDLINLSIAGPNDPLLGRLIDKALQNGTIIVAARPRSTTAETAYPAGHSGVLAISFGPASDGTILAPGEQIMVALPGNGYDFRSGSSLAAANASGVIALLLERQPDLGSARIADVLRHSQFVDGQDREVINACRALAYIDIAHECP